MTERKDPREERLATDLREELLATVLQVRAYLEAHGDAGTYGFPRAARSSAPRAPQVASPVAVPVSAPVVSAPVVSAPVVSAEPALVGRGPGRGPGSSSGEPKRPAEGPKDADLFKVDPFAELAPGSSRGPAAAPTSASSTGEPRSGAEARPAPPVVLGPERERRLVVLNETVRSCTKCALAATRTNTVFSRGNPHATLCFVGEAPGADEDAQGLPFVGRAGQLLDRMIGAMGLDPAQDVYICNILKCRPPDNRRPMPEEMDACFPYLHEQLELVSPKVIVALGNTAVAGLLGSKLGITKVRGSWKLYRGRVLVMPTYHPSYLLRPSPQQQEAKRQAWEDLQAVMKELGLAAPRGARPRPE